MFKSIVLLEERIVLDASVIYVDGTAAGGGNGDSWALAYNNLDDALAEAAASPGSQIWIADGNYKPSGGLESSTFSLPNDVALYGGFSGNETQLQQRDPAKYITILSGDILGDDNLGNKTDNVWHVVTAGNAGTQTGVTALLDGITITGGYADGPSASLDDSGGGLYVRWGSNITLNDMIFLKNNASEGPNVQSNFLAGGGGIFGFDAGTLITVTNSSFISNVANGLPNVEHAGFGGAINMAGDATLHLYDSAFTDNTGWRAGGAVRIRNSADNIISGTEFQENSVSRPDFFATTGGALSIQGSLVEISNSNFLNNHADSANITGGGGAIFVDSVFGRLTRVNVMDSYFEGNTATIFGGGAILALGTAANPNSLLSINDSTFVNNESSNGGAVYINSFNSEINNSKFYDNHSRLFGGAVSYSNFFDTFFGLPTTKSLTINHSDFKNNTVEPTQFEMDMHGLILNIFGFSQDAASVGGGAAISNHENGNVIINSSRFDHNIATNSLGGAVLNGGVYGQRFSNPSDILNSDTLNLNDNVLTDNKAVSGGALAAISIAPIGTPGNVVSVSDSVFKRNQASEDGGAVYLNRVDATLVDNTFHANNNALGQGDKVYGLDSLVNGVISSHSSAAAALLIHTNTFKNLDSDDIIMN